MASSKPTVDDTPVVDEDAPGPPISVPDTGEHSEGGKIKMIVQLLKKCLGVKDIAAMRLSLPASLLEPIPNLEFWHYLDRPDMFAAINDSNDPFERMLAVIRFTFTKDLKFIRDGVCKPYNSVLGEHFRAHWDIVPVTYSSESLQYPTPRMFTVATPSFPEHFAATSETTSIKSTKSTKSASSAFSLRTKQEKSPSTAPTSPSTELGSLQALSDLDLMDRAAKESRIRIVYVTEQVSHHPPVSAYFASCPARHLELSGIDQIFAKVSGTSLRVGPGQYNQGLFVRVTGGPGAGEMYQITHPVASVNGILRGSFYVTVGDSTIITCEGHPGQKFRTIIEYKEESWLGKAHFLVEGIIHTVHDGETDYKSWTKVKHVPHSHVVAAFDGSWRGHIRWRRVGSGSYPLLSPSSPYLPSTAHVRPPCTSASSPAASKTELGSGEGGYMTLLDLSALKVIPKHVRPLEKQLPHESRKLWASVTENLLKKQFSEATKEKVAIEQWQRDEAAERKRKGVEFVPRYFEKSLEKGFVNLTLEGRAAVEEEFNEESSFPIEGSDGAQLSS